MKKYDALGILSDVVVSCYKSMTIRSKKDVEMFLKSFHGKMHIAGDVYDVIIARDGDVKIFYRSINSRGNIYMPYFQTDDPVDFVWRYRKTFNRRIKGEKE